MSVGPHRVFVDTGVFEYSAGERRSRSRSTSAHNTLTLDDRDQCEFWSSFRMGRRAQVTMLKAEHTDTGIIVDAVHDGYAYMPGKPRHRRCIEMRSDGLLRITETISGGQGQNARARLLLHPLVQIVNKTAKHLQLNVGGRSVTIETAEAVLSVKPAVWWPDFGVEQSTQQVVVELGTAPGTWSYQIMSQLS